MPTLNPWVILGIVAMLIGTATGGYIWGDSSRNTAWLAKTETDKRLAIEEALTTERDNNAKANIIIRQQVAEQAAIAQRLRSDLISLRNRPDRSSAASQAAGLVCQSATGAQLSRPDAEFLIWESARADDIRAGLIACYKIIDITQQASND